MSERAISLANLFVTLRVKIFLNRNATPFPALANIRRTSVKSKKPGDEPGHQFLDCYIEFVVVTGLLADDDDEASLAAALGLQAAGRRLAMI